MVTQAHNFDMMPGDQRLCRKMAAMSLRGPLVAGCSFFYNRRYQVGQPSGHLHCGQKGHEGVVDAQISIKRHYITAVTAGTTTTTTTARLSAAKWIREKSHEVNHVCVEGQDDATTKHPRIPNFLGFDSSSSTKMRKNAATPFCNNIGRNKTCLLHCEAELLLFFSRVSVISEGPWRNGKEVNVNRKCTR